MMIMMSNAETEFWTFFKFLGRNIFLFWSEIHIIFFLSCLALHVVNKLIKPWDIKSRSWTLRLCLKRSDQMKRTVYSFTPGILNVSLVTTCDHISCMIFSGGKVSRTCVMSVFHCICFHAEMFHESYLIYSTHTFFKIFCFDYVGCL